MFSADVPFRPMFMNDIGFCEQCQQFVAAKLKFYFMDAFQLQGGFAPFYIKLLLNPFLYVDGLSGLKNFIILILEKIYAGFFGKLMDFLFI